MADLVLPTNGDWLGLHAASTALALTDAATGESVSFAAWNARVVRTARWLAGRGIGKGDRVGILARRRLDVLDLWLACGKLGAVAQMLNVRLTAAELGAQLHAAPPRLLVHDEAASAIALRLDVARATLGALCQERAGLSGEPFAAAPVRPEDPWVVCYTGGSTGTPKGALLTHGGILANAVATVRGWGVGAGDVALLNAPLFHVGGLFVLTAPLLLAGGRSIVADRFEAGEALALFGRGEVTAFFGVPTMFGALVRHPRFATTPLDHLRFVVSGGAPCPEAITRALRDRGVPFRQGYGLTEAGPNNFHVPDAELDALAGTVGYPLPGVEARIVDPAGAPLPAGAPGELWLRGPHLFGGYLGDRGEGPKDGWLHTGDLAVVDARGAYTIVGRLKDVILCGGENVYPAEIEGVLASHARVAEVCVIAVPDPRLGEVGRAVVVPEADAAGLPADLLAFARQRLARFKVPKDVVVAAELPRTPTGKVDRRAVFRAFGRDG